ncbi:NrpR regulatory domain-containing protein [Halobellus ordinarius]|uniref:NrpR regulatory domain-containing protein n=1 Tax=Halobellus ordinarius TaxID=3075120 RepID=UPI0028805D6A|nr:NrpR regulatory domain-containing protein [Halobellus sp. ZY16]
MASGGERRRYDLLRLIDENEPIGSIRLVDLMQQRGYSIKDRTIRLLLSELDDQNLTEKVSGKGRRLTPQGRRELKRGDVSGRLEQIRERIATLTSEVTYDPAEDGGEVVAGAGRVPAARVDEAFDLLTALHESEVGPVPVSVVERGRTVKLAVPSSITIDGVLLSRGINARLVTAGLVEYDGEITRYIDAISGEGSTMDVVRLLVQADRTDVDGILHDCEGVLIVDSREFPLTRFDEAQDLSTATRDRIGGVLSFRRPRESGQVPAGTQGWEFASCTYGGVGEMAFALLHEHGLLSEWDSLDGLRPRSAFEAAPALRERL